MFEPIIAPIINKLIGDYVTGLETTQMSIGLWQGDVVLNQLQLRKDALKSLNLPIHVAKGYIGELSLKIPWNDLKNKPVKVVIKDLHLVAASRPKETDVVEKTSQINVNHGDDDKDDVLNRFINDIHLADTRLSQDELNDLNHSNVEKINKLKLMDPFLKKAEFHYQIVANNQENGGTDDNQMYIMRPPTAVISAALLEKSKLNFNNNMNNNDKLDSNINDNQSGFITQLITKIIDNLQITIKDIHIRYEQDFDDNLFAIGLSLDELSAVSTDENWIPTFIQDTNKTIYKLLKLGKLACYWDVNSIHLNLNSNFNQFINQSRKLINFNDNDTQNINIDDDDNCIFNHQYILKPVSGEARIISKKKNPIDKSAKHSAIINFDDLAFSMDDYQYLNLLNVIESFNSYIKSKRYLKFRPNNIKVKDNPKIWLLYAIKSILYEIYQTKKVWSWNYIHQRILERKRYIYLFTKKQYFKANQIMPDELAKSLGVINDKDKDEDMKDLSPSNLPLPLSPIDVNDVESPASYNELPFNNNNEVEKLTVEEKNELIELEKKISFDNLILFRSIAYNNIIKFNGYKPLLSIEEKQKLLFEKQQKLNSESKSWVSSISNWWYGGDNDNDNSSNNISSENGNIITEEQDNNNNNKSSNMDNNDNNTKTNSITEDEDEDKNENEDMKQQESITDKDLEDLYNTIEYDPNKPINQSINLSPDSIIIDIKCKLNSGSLNLNHYNKSTKSSKQFTNLIFEKLKINFIQYSKGLKTTFSIKDMVMKDLSNNNSSKLYPILISAIKSLDNNNNDDIKMIPDSNSNNDDDDNNEISNFLTISAEHNPMDSTDLDGKLNLSMLPLKVNYNPKLVNSIIRFFNPSKVANLSTNNAMYTIQSTVSDTIQGIKDSTRANMESIILEQKRIMVNINIAAPIFIFPEDCTNINSNILVVDTGKLIIENEIVKKSTVEELKSRIEEKSFDKNDDKDKDNKINLETLEYVGKLAYDRYICNLSSVQLLMSNSSDDCIKTAQNIIIKNNQNLLNNSSSSDNNNNNNNEEYNEEIDEINILKEQNEIKELIMKPKLHIIEPIDASFNIDVCTISKYLEWNKSEAQIKISGSLKRIHVNLSDSKYKSFMNILNGVLSSISLDDNNTNSNKDTLLDNIPDNANELFNVLSNRINNQDNNNMDIDSTSIPIKSRNNTNNNNQYYSRSPSPAASFSNSYKDSNLLKLHPLILDGDEFFDAAESPLYSTKSNINNKRKSSLNSTISKFKSELKYQNIQSKKHQQLNWIHSKLNFSLNVNIKAASITLMKQTKFNNNNNNIDKDIDKNTEMLISTKKNNASMHALLKTNNWKLNNNNNNSNNNNNNNEGFNNEDIVEIALARLFVQKMKLNVLAYNINGINVNIGIKSVMIEDLISSEISNLSNNNISKTEYFLTPTIYEENQLSINTNTNKDLINIAYKQNPKFDDSSIKNNLVEFSDDNVVVKSAIEPIGNTQNVDIDFDAVSMVMNSNSIIVLYDFIIQTFSNGDNSDSNTNSATNPDTDSSRLNESNNLIYEESSLKCNINLTSVKVLIKDSISNIATAYLGQVSTQIDLSSTFDTGSSIKIIGKIGNVKVINEMIQEEYNLLSPLSNNSLSSSTSSLNLLPISKKEFLGIEGDHVADFKFQTFDQNYLKNIKSLINDNENNYDTELWIRISSVRLVIMDELIKRLQCYLGELAHMHILLETAREKAVNTANQIQQTAGKFHYDIQINTPLFIYPCKSLFKNMLLNEINHLNNNNLMESQLFISQFSDDIIFYPGSVSAINKFIIDENSQQNTVLKDNSNNGNDTNSNNTILSPIISDNIIFDKYLEESRITITESHLALRNKRTINQNYKEESNNKDNKDLHDYYQIVDGIDVELVSTSNYEIVNDKEPQPLKKSSNFVTKDIIKNTNVSIKVSPIKMKITSLTQYYLFQFLNSINSVIQGPNSNSNEEEENNKDQSSKDNELNNDSSINISNTNNINNIIEDLLYVFIKEESNTELSIELPKVLLELFTIDLNLLQEEFKEIININSNNYNLLHLHLEKRKELYNGNSFGVYDLQQVILKHNSKSQIISKLLDNNNFNSQFIPTLNWYEQIADFSIKSFTINDTRENIDTKYRDIWKRKNEGSLLRVQYKKNLDYDSCNNWIEFLINDIVHNDNGNDGNINSLIYNDSDTNNEEKNTIPREHLSVVSSGATVLVVPNYIIETINFLTSIKNEEENNINDDETNKDKSFFLDDSSQSLMVSNSNDSSSVLSPPQLPVRDSSSVPKLPPRVPESNLDLDIGNKSSSSFKRQQRIAYQQQRDRPNLRNYHSSHSSESSINVDDIKSLDDEDFNNNDAILLDDENSLIQSNSLPNTNDDINENAINLEKSKRRLALTVDLGNIEFVVLQNPSSEKSDAVSFSVPQLAIQFSDDTTTVTLQEVQASIYDMSNAVNKRSNFIDPFNATIVYKDRILNELHNRGVHFVDIHVDISEIVSRVSYRDFVLIQDVIHQLTLGNDSKIDIVIEDDQNNNRNLINNSIEKLNDDDNFEDNNNKVILHESRNSRERLSVVLHGVRLVLIDDLNNFHLPIFNFVLKETNIKASDWSSSLELRVEPSLLINFFNIKNSHWEPLAEPWSFTFAINKLSLSDTIQESNEVDNNNGKGNNQIEQSSLNSDITAIDFTSQQKIELTISQTLIETLLTTFHNWNTVGNIDVYERREVHHPYKIRNQTGCNIYIWSSNIEGDGLNTELKHLQNGESIPWEVDDRKSNSDNIYPSGSKISIQFESVPWEVVKAIPIHMEGCYPYGLRPARDNQITDALICDVKLKGNIKIVTLRSALFLRNESGIELEFLLLTLSNQARGLPVKVKPGEVYNVPILSVFDDLILIRPNLGNHAYEWSTERLSWKNFKNQQSSLIRCKSKIKTNLPFRFQLTANVSNDYSHISYPIMEWIVYPPFQIENLLPYDFLYIVYDKTSRTEQRGTLRKGQIESMFTLDPTHLLALGIELPGAKFTGNSIAIISNTEMQYHDDTLPLVHQKTNRQLNLRLKYSDNLQHGCKKVMIYCPYVVVNKSGLDIGIAPKLFLSSSKDFVIQASSKEIKKVEPQMFSFDSLEPMKSKVSLRTRYSKESAPINFDVVGSSFSVTLDPSRNENPITKLGISINEGDGKYFLTKVVTITPRFIVKNNLKHQMLIKQFQSEKLYTISPNESISLVEFTLGNLLNGLASSPDRFAGIVAESTLLSDGMQTPIRSDIYNPASRYQAVISALFPSSDVSDYISLRFSGKSSKWSNPFCINEIGSIYVKSERTDSDIIDLVKIEVTIDNATIFVMLSETESRWPIIIKNKMETTMSIRQYGSSNPCLISGANGLSYPYAWDYPSAPRKILMISVEGSTEERPIDPLEIGQQMPLSYYIKKTQTEGVLAINVAVEGLTTVITLYPYSEKKSAFRKSSINEINVDSETSMIMSDNNYHRDDKMMNFKAKTKDYNINFRLNIKLEGVGLSLINKDMKELLYASFKDVRFVVADNSSTTSVSTSIKWMQVDNQLIGGVEPILIYPTVIPKDKDSNYHPVLMVALSKSKDDSYGVVYYEFFTLLLQELSIELDEDFLLNFMEMFRLDLPWLKISEPIEMCDFVNEIKEPQLIVGSERLYFEHFLLQPMQMNVSFVRSEALDTSLETRSQHKSRDISSIIFDVLTMTLGNVHDAPLQLNALELRHPNVTLEMLKELMYKFYSHEIMNQFHRIIGAADFLGNPVGLFTNVASGVSDFFYEPLQGFEITRPQDFGIGVAKGTASLFRKTVFGFSDTFTKITGSLGKGLSVFAFDNEFQKSRRLSSRNRPKHAAAGVTNGATFLAKSVASGLTGVISKPMEGAAQEGVGGFFKGLGKGMIGMVTKPVIGVIDLANNVGEGIRSTTTAFDNTLDKQRLTRYIGPDKVIRPYDEMAALGLYLMMNVDDGSFSEEDFCAILNLRKDSLMLIATYKHIMCIRQNRMRTEWIIPFNILGTIRLNPVSGELAFYGKPGTRLSMYTPSSTMNRISNGPALPHRLPQPTNDIFGEERRMFGTSSRSYGYNSGSGPDSGSETDGINNSKRTINKESSSSSVSPNSNSNNNNSNSIDQETEITNMRGMGGGRFYTMSVLDNIGAELGLINYSNDATTSSNSENNGNSNSSFNRMSRGQRSVQGQGYVMSSGSSSIGFGNRRLLFVVACPDIHEAHEFANKVDSVFTAFVDERKPFD